MTDTSRTPLPPSKPVGRSKAQWIAEKAMQFYMDRFREPLKATLDV